MSKKVKREIFDENIVIKKKKVTDSESERKEDKPKMVEKKKSKKQKRESSSEESEDDETESEDEEKKSKKDKKRGSPKSNSKALLQERYDGTTPLTIFLTQLESCAKYNKWSVKDKATHLRVSLKKAIHLRLSLKGNASYIIDNETFEDATYEQLVARLKSRFGTEGQSYLYQAQLRIRRRGKNVKLQALNHDISRMAGLAFPGKSSIHREIAEKEAFIEAINDGSLRMRIRDKEPNGLEQALRIALLAEANTADRYERYERYRC